MGMQVSVLHYLLTLSIEKDYIDTIDVIDILERKNWKSDTSD